MAAQRVVLHIGTMKAGSTFLQSVLQTDVGRLREVGVDAMAGTGRSAVGDGRPHTAAKRLVRQPSGAKPWDRIVAGVRSSPHDTVVITSELLSFLSPQAVEHVVASLEGIEVTAVVVVRDQLSAIPAQWQSFTRNQGRAAFATYARQIRAAEPSSNKAHRSFHRAQDVTGILDRWSGRGLDRLVVVSAPPSGSAPELLWQRFREAAGIPPHEITLGTPVANPSLGYAGSDYVRRLNAHLTGLRKLRYRKLVRPLAIDVLAPLRGVQGQPRLDRASAEFAQRRNQEIRDAIAAGGADFVGAPSDLPVDIDLATFPEEVPPADPAQVRQCAELALDHAAARAGVTAPSPAGLAGHLVATADLLRQVRIAPPQHDRRRRP